MPTDGRIEAAIEALAADLKPVRRAPGPLSLAGLWIGALIASGAALALVSDDRAMMSRLMAAPDLWLAAVGSAVTAILAGLAALELARPDGSPRWALVPLPGLALWLGASGWGCLRTWVVPGVSDASLAESRTCFVFIALVSAPLSAVMLVLVRRAYPLRPGLTTLMAGLGVAAGANTLLNFFHPYDASASDLAVHLVAVLVVIGCNRLLAVVLPGRHGLVPDRLRGRHGAA